MAEPLTVDLNHGAIHAIEVTDSYTAAGPFIVRLVNHGPSAHVHLHLDDALSTVARLAASNHFVEGGRTRDVEVSVADTPDELSGRLSVVTGYGVEQAAIEVTVSAPPTVAIDAALERPPDPPARGSRPSPGYLARGALTVVGVALVVGVVTLVDETVAVGLGVLALVVAVAVAVALLRR